MMQWDHGQPEAPASALMPPLAPNTDVLLLHFGANPASTKLFKKITMTTGQDLSQLKGLHSPRYLNLSVASMKLTEHFRDLNLDTCFSTFLSQVTEAAFS